MVICCSALGCKNKQSISTSGNKLSFHRFPRDKNLSDAWLAASKRLDFVPSKYSYFCCEHFTEDQFNRTQKGVRLRPNAVPTVFGVTPKPNNRVPRKPLSKNLSEAQPTVKIAPKQLFPVQPTVKIAPKPTFEVQPTIKIAPKPIFEAQPLEQVFDEQTPITIVQQPSISEALLTPSPVITNLSSIADTVVSSSLIKAALSAYKQSTNSPVSHDGTPVSIYVVHPQPNGSNIVTIPSISNYPMAGTLPKPNGGSLPTSAQTGDALQDALNNIQKIKQYEARIKKYRKEIKLLQQQHKRQHHKIEKLQSIIKDLKCPEFLGKKGIDEDVSEEEMSEDEVYAELLKHQSESEKKNDNSEEEEDYGEMLRHQLESGKEADNSEV